MQVALTSVLARRAEELAVAGGATLSGLMDEAGAAVARQVQALRADGRVAIAAGPGNNGGDGWVAARALAASGRDVVVVAMADPDALPEPARAAAARAVSEGIRWLKPSDLFSVERELADASIVVDALLGVGVHGVLRDPLPAVVAAIEDAGLPVLAVDVPTGVDSDTGAVLGAAVTADVTVTFGALKTGLLQYPGAGSAGVVVVADIGLPSPPDPGGVEVWEGDDYAEVVPVPRPDDHKGSRGRVLVIAGSAGMSGAAVLAASGAQRTGAGYVTLAVPASLLDLADAALLSAVTSPLSETPSRALDRAAGYEALRLAEDADAVVLGPGLGRAPETASAVRRIVEGCESTLVIDADALNILSESPEVLASRQAPTVITPHPGEAGRLLGGDSAGVQENRYAAARALAAPGRVAILKGARSVIACVDRVAVNMTGSAALATTGTGDVLAGVVGALAAQGLEPFDAAVAGAYLHGRAGDLAAGSVGYTGVVAGDLLPELPRALEELALRARGPVR